MRFTVKELADIERTLGDSLGGVASELRLIEAADYVAFIRTGQTANLRNIVQSSTELHFKPGTLRLAEPGEAELDWNSLPLVVLPMEFRHGPVRVYFKLKLEAAGASVNVEALTATEQPGNAEDLRARLARALDAACLSQRLSRNKNG